FHNDNSIGALLDIPGLLIASPSRGDDAVGMLRTCAELAAAHGMVCVFLEPIALYMQKDLYEPGDDGWQFGYPAPSDAVRFGEARVYHAADDDHLTLVSFANGVPMSLRARRQLADAGIRARVVDLRWLSPLPWAQLHQHARATGRVLVVDECRHQGGGPSAHIVAELLAEDPSLRLARVTSRDTFIPLGPAADQVLLSVDDIVAASQRLVSREPS
ncbi:MAG: MFS transporter, partial [Planctomycetes bacterium]|nr:MFS transporter [Planctomycetota bacterium]